MKIDFLWHVALHDCIFFHAMKCSCVPRICIDAVLTRVFVAFVYSLSVVYVAFPTVDGNADIHVMVRLSVPLNTPFG